MADRSMTIYLEERSGPVKNKRKVVEYLHAKCAVSSPKCEYSNTIFGNSMQTFYYSLGYLSILDLFSHS